jgi:hypothetical protein
VEHGELTIGSRTWNMAGTMVVPTIGASARSLILGNDVLSGATIDLRAMTLAWGEMTVPLIPGAQHDDRSISSLRLEETTPSRIEVRSMVGKTIIAYLDPAAPLTLVTRQAVTLHDWDMSPSRGQAVTGPGRTHPIFGFLGETKVEWHGQLLDLTGAAVVEKMPSPIRLGSPTLTPLAAILNPSLSVLYLGTTSGPLYAASSTDAGEWQLGPWAIAGPNPLPDELVDTPLPALPALPPELSGPGPPVLENMDIAPELLASQTHFARLKAFVGKAEAAAWRVEDGSDPPPSRLAVVRLLLDPLAKLSSVNARPRPLNDEVREKVRLKLKAMEQAGLIRRAKSPPVVSAARIVPKPNGGVRITGDYRPLNDCLLPPRYPMRRMDRILREIAKSKLWASVDLRGAFYQLVLDKRSVPLTAITFGADLGVWEFQVGPMGVSSMPAEFQKAMEFLLRDLPDVWVYIDDIIIGAMHMAELLDRLEMVMARLSAAGLTAAPSKTKIGHRSLKVLGSKVEHNSISMPPDRVSALTELPLPPSKPLLMNFIHVTNAYQSHLPGLAPLLVPLRQTAERSGPGRAPVYDDSAQEAFLKIKALIATAASLTPYHEDGILTAQTDFSPEGMSLVVSWRPTASAPAHPVLFRSRRCTPQETRYAAVDGEVAALSYALDELEQLGVSHREIEWYSDSRPNVLSIASPAKTTSRRWERIAQKLARFRLVALYEPGKVILADLFSRLFPDVTDEPSAALHPRDTPMIASLSISPNHHTPLSMPVDDRMTLRSQQREDQTLKGITERAVRGRQSKYHVDLDGLLMRGKAIVAPKVRRDTIMKMVHAGHAPASRMKEMLRPRWWWPGRDKDLDTVVAKCDACNAVRYPSSTPVSGGMIIADARWHTLQADIFTVGHADTECLLLTDVATGYVEPLQIITKGAHHLAAALTSPDAWRFGIPDTIITDLQLCSREIETALLTQGTKLHPVPAGHHTSMGQVERMQQSLRHRVAKLTHDWDPATPLWPAIKLAAAHFNMEPSASRGAAPAELMLGKIVRHQCDPPGPALVSLPSPQLIEQTATAAVKEANAMREDVKAARDPPRQPTFTVGDRVDRLMTVPGDKLAAQHNAFGPFIITEVHHMSCDIETIGLTPVLTMPNISVTHLILSRSPSPTTDRLPPSLKRKHQAAEANKVRLQRKQESQETAKRVQEERKLQKVIEQQQRDAARLAKEREREITKRMSQRTQLNDSLIRARTHLTTANTKLEQCPLAPRGSSREKVLALRNRRKTQVGFGRKT